MNIIWERSRQAVVLMLFMLMTVTICVGFALSIIALLTYENGYRIELARWVIETLVGGFVAGLIGFIMVKSFER